jgi:hypothetical protein
MLLLSDKKSSVRGRVREALERARQTYREYSGASDEEPAPATGEVVDPAPLPKRRPRADEPDVYLDVPKVEVDEIELKLDELNARVALQARVLDLVTLDVGIDAELKGVDLDIKGVRAEALLKVRLDNLAVIVDRVMDTIDRNPQVLQGLTERLGATLEQVGNGAGSAVDQIAGSASSAVEHLSGADGANG